MGCFLNYITNFSSLVQLILRPEIEQKNSISVLSIEKVTDKLSSKHQLSLYVKLAIVRNKED